MSKFVYIWSVHTDSYLYKHLRFGIKFRRYFIVSLDRKMDYDLADRTNDFFFRTNTSVQLKYKF